MRKRCSVLVAVAIATSVGVGAQPADAAANVSCKTASGKATFSPALPKSSDAHTVRATLSMMGKVGGCTGGVTSGTVTFKSVKNNAALNCKRWLAYNAASGIIGTETIKWNTGRTSTVPLTLRPVKGQPTRRTLGGTVNKGAFSGYRQTGTLVFAWPKNACKTAGLATMIYKQVTATALKQPTIPPPP